jgi:hypothetical protein
MAISQSQVEMLAGLVVGGLLGKVASKYIFEEEGSCVPYVLAGAGVGVLLVSAKSGGALTARTNGGMIVSKEAEKLLAQVNPEQLFAPLETDTVKIGDVGPNPKQIDFYQGK